MSAHGNYKGYQGATRHSSSGHHQGAHVLDPRLLSLNSLDPTIFTSKHVLDIGCNNGNISVDLALHFSPSSVTGLDLDPSLIQSAKSHLSFKFSRLPPNAPPSDPSSSTSPVESSFEKSYFPVSSVLKHGHIPYPLHSGKDEMGEEADPVFPFNVNFECIDVVKWISAQTGVPAPAAASTDPDAMDVEPMSSQATASSIDSEEGQYDVILLLSVLKWIHLHHGDAILPYLFQQLHKLSKPDARLVLEAQDWESYEKAAKKNPRLWPKVNALKVKSKEEVDRVISEGGWKWEMGLDEERDAKGKVRRRGMGIWRRI